ncbi:DUF3040 domain-containing protein [Kitasatospora sp. NPDC054939]
MDGPALSGRERRLLDEIECELRQDARLDRRLSTMGAKRPNRLWAALRRLPPGMVMAVSALTAICLAVGARTPTPVVLTAVAAVWAVLVTLCVGVTVALRRRREPPHPPDSAPGTPPVAGEAGTPGGRGLHRRHRVDRFAPVEGADGRNRWNRLGRLGRWSRLGHSDRTRQERRADGEPRPWEDRRNPPEQS